MKSNNIALLSLFCLASAVSANASANSYLTATATDSATFANGKGTSINVSVSPTTTAGWNKYSDFLGTGARKVWTTSVNESVYLFNEANNTAEKMVDFADPVGTKYTFALGSCTKGGMLAQKGLTMATPVGTYKDVVRISFDAKCADGGLIEAWFAPQAGLIKWSSQTLLGPNNFELNNGKIAGQTLGLQSALKANLNIPKTAFNLGATAEMAAASIILSNTSNQNMVLHFNSGQEFEISLLNSNNQVLNTWSAAVRFVQGTHDVTIAPGESKSFGGNLALRYVSGTALASDIYNLRIELKAASYAIGNNAAVVGTIKADTPILVNRL
jgi:hypothetical protein